jgi:hypothetical protein
MNEKKVGFHHGSGRCRRNVHSVLSTIQFNRAARSGVKNEP